MEDCATGEKVKFANYGKVWNSGIDPNELAMSMNQASNKLSDWTYKWTLKLNAGITEYCLFTRDASHFVSELKSSEKVRVLGVILDKKLTLRDHLDIVGKKQR